MSETCEAKTSLNDLSYIVFPTFATKMSKGGDTHEMVITNTAFPPICFSNLLFKKLEWALIKGERVVESKNKNIDLETSTGTLPKKNKS